MTRWMRFEHDGREGFGALEDDTVRVHQGDLFAGPHGLGQAPHAATRFAWALFTNRWRRRKG